MQAILWLVTSNYILSLVQKKIFVNAFLPEADRNFKVLVKKENRFQNKEQLTRYATGQLSYKCY